MSAWSIPVSARTKMPTTRARATAGRSSPATWSVSLGDWIDQEGTSRCISRTPLDYHPQMNRANPKVDAYITEERKWRKESERLRKISLGCGLTEELKWGKPCYTFQESNVVIIQGFNEYCALMFCKGALLKDPKGILSRIGQYTQAARQARFTNSREIVAK